MTTAYQNIYKNVLFAPGEIYLLIYRIYFHQKGPQLRDYYLINIPPICRDMLCLKWFKKLTKTE